MGSGSPMASQLPDATKAARKAIPCFWLRVVRTSCQQEAPSSSQMIHLAYLIRIATNLQTLRYD